MVDLPTVGRFVGGAGYAPLTETSLRALVSGVPACSDLLKSDPADWKIREVGAASDREQPVVGVIEPCLGAFRVV